MVEERGDHPGLGDRADDAPRGSTLGTPERGARDDPAQPLRPAPARVLERGRDRCGFHGRGGLRDDRPAADPAGPVGGPAVGALEDLALLEAAGGMAVAVPGSQAGCRRDPARARSLSNYLQHGQQPFRHAGFRPDQLFGLPTSPDGGRRPG